ncbi:LemA family protein [Candidatus Woesearchaeota archaeon]|nr:LemA family protein [Candidatus Woesearchaeota archaeon]
MALSTGAIILISVGVVVLFVIFLYNSLIRLRMQVKNSWAQIDVQLKRRNDLIPNLVSTVKGYAKHEKTLLTDITKARSELMKADTPSKMAKSNNQISEALKSLFAVSENYPDLKANQNFLQLQEELTGTENKISYSRQHYNDMVMVFNTKIQTFPNNMIAKQLGFSDEEAFEATEAEKKNVKVEF